MGDTLRTPAVAAKYREYRSEQTTSTICPLCERPAEKSFNYWKIIHNEFPYDLLAKKHDMLVPLRHAAELEINSEEWEEYKIIKRSDMQKYDYLIEGMEKTKSLPEHFHVHLIVGKELL